MNQVKVTRKTHVTDSNIDLLPGVHDVTKNGPVTPAIAKYLIDKGWARELTKDEQPGDKKAK